MSETLIRHQTFEYKENEPFQIYNVYGTTMTYDTLLAHWHSELEVVYLAGHSRHYIDGHCIDGGPGDFIVTNCESVHKIEPQTTQEELDRVVAVVLLIHDQFLIRNFPQFKSIYFTNDHLPAGTEITEIMEKISAYAEKKTHTGYDYLYVNGMILELLYHMCERGTVSREALADVNYDKNIERIKGVLQYVENHYRENITEAGIAEKFYFSPVYFSRYFKRCTGMTFIAYLTGYRLNKARRQLLYSEHSILDIALENGFSDSRRMSLAFQKTYGCTPRQYKKDAKTGKLK